MKRITIKPVLVVLTALSLFILFLLTCFPLLNTTVFWWEQNRGGQESKSQIPGNTSDSANSSDSKNDTITFNFENPVNPEISDYIILNITAKNTGLAKYPYGSIAVNLSEEKTVPLNGSASGSEADGIVNGEIGGVKDDKAFNENISAGSSAEINRASSTGAYKIQERTRIFVDGIRHNYYLAVGENKYWRHDWNLEGPTLKEQVSSLEIEIPEIEGIDIQLNGVSLNQRPVFAVDSHINYFFKNYFQLSYIDRFLTPAYIFLILFTIGFFPFSILLKRTGDSGKNTRTNDLESVALKSPDLKDRDPRIETADANNIYTGNLNSNLRSALQNCRPVGIRIDFKILALLIPLFLLIFFSFYFINNYIFTVKGYWDSYKKYIISGQLDKTYYGFSDFEKFVTWVGEKVPQSQNVIVLVKGEPVYIMAQMVYGLYPRDIKFLNISSMSADEIADKITNLNFSESSGGNTIESANAASGNNIVENKNNTGSSSKIGLINGSSYNTGLNNIDGAQTYEYIVVLSETDKVFLGSVKVKLECSYRENAGFLYKLILK
jgi:hypothetical protein